MKLRQLSLFLENRPGALRLPCQVLGTAGIDILSLSLADTQQFGILRLVVKEEDRARKVLEEAGCVVKVTDVLAVEGTLPHYQIVLTREKGLDEVEVRVEVTPEVFSDQVRALESLQHKLEQSLDHTLGIRARVTLVGPRTIQRSEGKATRVIDKRQI
jgi:hypothetical protein